MKNILYTIILSFLFSFSVFADFQTGWIAYIADDFATAYKELKPFAEQGNMKAQHALGNMYSLGKGVTQDYKEALKWTRLAAEQGYVNSQYNLGLMHYYGEGVIQDYKAAMKWFRLIAEQGDAQAQYILGLMFLNGEGVIKDDIIAHMWFNIAASNGNEDAKEERDGLENNFLFGMTSEQVIKAQELARECIKKNYKDCG